ncbi:UvrB/UvrC motif-containing protein [Solibacillus silvestris]|uniref:UvrB/UvrC motif-containing protein n=1 Tax=Solibacillus silvestris TaxID=76853 RepID=UPI003F81BB39
MICEHCKQRHANVMVTQVHNGQKVERHYCEVCATQFHPFQFEVSEEPTSLQQLISNWFNFVPTTAKKENATASASSPKACPSCGFSYRQFLKQGKFGCGQCYVTFSEQLPQLLERLQAGTQHVGYVEEAPSNEKIEQQISELRASMQQAISEERFEDAASIRDEIRGLENKINKEGEGDA